MKSLILGTANFYRKYGISSQHVLDLRTIESIINLAQQNGIYHFDTAKSYGDSEKILGKFLEKLPKLLIDSKIGAEECKSIDSIMTAVQESLQILGIPKLNTLYLHNPDLLVGEHSSIVRQGMERVVESGLANHLGVSVYTLDQIISSKSKLSTFSHLQILENICDRRFIDSPLLKGLAESGIVINVRSVFLQGLLLRDPRGLSKKMQAATDSILQIRDFANVNNKSSIDVCLGYVKLIPWASKFIVGVESSFQLQQIFNSNFDLPENWKEFILPLPKNLKDPRLWQS